MGLPGGPRHLEQLGQWVPRAGGRCGVREGPRERPPTMPKRAGVGSTCPRPVGQRPASAGPCSAVGVLPVGREDRVSGSHVPTGPRVTQLGLLSWRVWGPGPNFQSTGRDMGPGLSWPPTPALRPLSSPLPWSPHPHPTTGKGSLKPRLNCVTQTCRPLGRGPAELVPSVNWLRMKFLFLLNRRQ